MLKNAENKKIIAWGKSKLFEFYQAYSKGFSIAYIIDSKASPDEKQFCNVPLFCPDVLDNEDPDNVRIIIFAVSNQAIQSILADLNRRGYALNVNVFLYSDLFYPSYQEKFQKIFGREPDNRNYAAAESFALSTKFPVHTTLLGNALFLDLLTEVKAKGRPDLRVAEVGAFNGGNALLACQQSMPFPFDVLDSFEGFPALSAQDPATKKIGDYNIETTLPYIIDNFSVFPEAKVIKGFVPEAFGRLKPDAKYGLVFYDCDLYQPALDTFEYFWNKIEPGGFLLIHDYVAEEGGFKGVKVATDEFFRDKKTMIHEFWENTMALIVKD